MGKVRTAFAAFLISILSLVSLYATGSNEFRLYEVPRNVANNSFVMIDLLGDSTISTSELTSDYAKSTNNNLAFVRLVDTLYKDTLTTNGNVQQSNANKAIITITSEDATGFYFVHEENPTEKYPFELECYLLTGVYAGDGEYNYTTSASTVAADSSTINSYTYTLTSVNKTSKGSNIIGSIIGAIAGNIYATEIHNYDFCIKLKPQSGVSYEPGYYTTTLILNSNEYQEAAKSNQGNNDKLSLDRVTSLSDIRITVRAFLGVDPEVSGDGMNYSFYISPGANTYDMDLEVATKYEVANLYFNKINDSGKTPPASNFYKRYTLYISPTSLYNVSGEYQFIKVGSEKQERSYGNTVDYKLYLKNSTGGYVDLSNVAERTYANLSTTNYTSLNMNTAEQKIVGAFRESDSVYVLLPLYTPEESGKNNGKTYRQEWELNCKLYLEPVIDTIPDSDGVVPKHQKGLYYSYLYFTVVTN